MDAVGDTVLKIKRFTFRFWPSIVCFMVFVILSSLGVWQLMRYEAKKSLLSHYANAQTHSPVALSKEPNNQNVLFKRIKVQGVFINQQTLLLAHRYHHHQLGFEVITPLEIDNTRKIVLVNRGWIKKSQAQSLLPVFGRQTLTGWIKTPEYRFILGKNRINGISQGPYQIQRINIKEIKEIIQQPLYPFVLRLDNSPGNQAFSYVRDWQLVNMSPQKNLGYAFQWFAMALALLIAFFIFSLGGNERLRIKA